MPEPAASDAPVAQPQPAEREPSTVGALSGLLHAPASRHEWILALQRTAGNQAVGRVLRQQLPPRAAQPPRPATESHIGYVPATRALARQTRSGTYGELFAVSEIDEQISQAEAAARSSVPESSFPLFGRAYEHIQQLLADRTRDELGLMDLGMVSPGRGPRRTEAYSALEPLIRRARRIIGFFPRLERDARARNAGADAERFYSLGLALMDRLRAEHTRGELAAATLFATEIDTERGRMFEIRGARGPDERVAVTAGQRVPDRGRYNALTTGMAEIGETIFGQEQLLSELQRIPEVAAVTHGSTPDLNDPGQRLRVWAAVFAHYRRERGDAGALTGLLRMIERHLISFTHHSQYDIRDFSGPSYLDRPMPEDVLGRAVQDCGVYALTVAYEVYRSVRDAGSPQLVRFQLFRTFSHVTLAIASPATDQVFLVNNNRITGPLPIAELQRLLREAHQTTFGHDDFIAPYLRADIGDTTSTDREFRERAWHQRERVAPAAGYHPGTTPLEAAGEDHMAAFRAADRYDQISDLVRSRAAALRGLPPAVVAARVQEGGATSLLNAGIALRDLYAMYAPNWRGAAAVDERGRTLRHRDLAARHLWSGHLASGDALLIMGRLLIYSRLAQSDPDAASLMQSLGGLSEFSGPLADYRRHPTADF